LPTVEDCEKLWNKYLKWTLNHCKQIWKVMKFFANKTWEDENRWYIVWFLHDIDWDFIWKIAEKHCQQDLENIMSEINAPKELIDDIKTHAYFITWIEPKTNLQKYITSVDELVWFINAYSLMRPNWMEWLKASSIMKKIKDKAFARWVDREQLKNCEKFLSIELKDFIWQVIEAMNS
jgi:predicted hydrolase (HD superfamily)